MLGLVKALQMTLALVAVLNVAVNLKPLVAELRRHPRPDLVYHRAMWVLIWFSVAIYFVPVSYAFMAMGSVPVIVAGVPALCRVGMIGGLTSAGTFFLAARGDTQALRCWSRFFAFSAAEMLLIALLASN